MRDVETVRQVRNLLPATETVESNGQGLKVDNSWLHQELDKYAADTSTVRYELLKRITERVKALDERLEELETRAVGTSASKADESRKLEEISRSTRICPPGCAGECDIASREEILQMGFKLVAET